MKALLICCLTFVFVVASAGFAQTTLQNAPPSSVAEDEQPITIKEGDKVSPLRVIHTANPKMPKDGLRGTVAIQGVVGTDGRLHNALIKRSLSPQHDASALEVVKEWRFEPVKKDGKPVAVNATVEVAFF
jgi:TonB family protein